jgi:hypothetical protein
MLRSFLRFLGHWSFSPWNILVSAGSYNTLILHHSFDHCAPIAVMLDILKVCSVRLKVRLRVHLSPSTGVAHKERKSSPD